MARIRIKDAKESKFWRNTSILLLVMLVGMTWLAWDCSDQNYDNCINKGENLYLCEKWIRL
jgi:hypothetical protein